MFGARALFDREAGPVCVPAGNGTRIGVALGILLITAASAIAAPSGGGGASGGGGGSGTVNSGAAGQIPFYSTNGTAVSPMTPSGDCSFVAPNTFTCNKVNGGAFAPSATTNTTNASNISAGTLPSGRLPALIGDTTTTAGSSITTTGIVHLAAKTIGSGGITSYNVTASDSVLDIDNTVTAGVFTINLLPVASDPNHTLVFNRIDTNVFPVVILPNGADTIEGSTHGMWMGGATAASSSSNVQIAATGMSRTITNDDVSDWKVIGITNPPGSRETYVRCIPTGNQALVSNVNKSVCSAAMPSLPFDPGVGCAYISDDEGGIAASFVTAPTAWLKTLTEFANGVTAHSDGHGWNGAALSAASPIFLPSVGVVDSVTSSIDPTPRGRRGTPNPTISAQQTVRLSPVARARPPEPARAGVWSTSRSRHSVRMQRHSTGRRLAGTVRIRQTSYVSISSATYYRK
jgi:hypothetical protein